MTAGVGRVLLAGVLAVAVRHADAAPLPPSAARLAPAARIAWREGAVDDAFVEASDEHRPLLLYWGAKWCPPCNMMQQTLFKDPEFTAATRGFIPVHLDGDARETQVWSRRFGVSDYPTVLVLRPDGIEIARLSGGSSAAELAQVLRVAAHRTTSTDDLLRRAVRPDRLSRDDWRLLADFDLFNDPLRLGDSSKQAAFASQLAAAAPDPALRRRFSLDALIARSAGGRVPLTPEQQVRLETVLPPLLADPTQVAAARQELTYSVGDVVLALPPGPRRRALEARLVAALRRMAADPGAPLLNRVYAARTEIALAKADRRNGAVPVALQAEVRRRVALADREARDPATRQAVMPAAGQLLADMGDDAGAERLWRAELPRAVTPFYYMVDLGRLEEQAKRPREALAWMRKAAEDPEGPSTRLQWTLEYSKGVMRLAPDDAASALAAAELVVDRIADAGPELPDRTRLRIAQWRAALGAWALSHGRTDAVTRIDARLASVGGGYAPPPSSPTT